MARGNPNIVEAGKKYQFTSENQPKNKGRKPRLYTIAKEGYRCSYEDYKEGVMFLMQCTLTELKAVTEKEDTPIWMRNIARADRKKRCETVRFEVSIKVKYTERLRTILKEQDKTIGEVFENIMDTTL